MPADRRIGASSVTKRIRGIKDGIMRHQCCGYDHGKSIIGYNQVLPLCTGATVYGALHVSRMPCGISWRRVNRHPAFPVAKPVDHAPRMGARSRLWIVQPCSAACFRASRICLLGWLTTSLPSCCLCFDYNNYTILMERTSHSTRFFRRTMIFSCAPPLSRGVRPNRQTRTE